MGVLVCLFFSFLFSLLLFLCFFFFFVCMYLEFWGEFWCNFFGWLFGCFELPSGGQDIHDWFRCSGCKCGFYRNEVLCPCSEIFLFTDLAWFNTEAPHSFSTSALCITDDFLLHALRYWHISTLGQFCLLGHHYITYCVIILLLQWRNSVRDLQMLLFPLPHLEQYPVRKCHHFVGFFPKTTVCFFFFLFFGPERLVSEWFSKALMRKSCQKFALTSWTCQSAKGTVSYNAALNQEAWQGQSCGFCSCLIKYQQLIACLVSTSWFFEW